MYLCEDFMMRRPKRYIAVISLLCVCFLMLATTVIPHHHHDDGSICIVLTGEEAEAAEDEPASHGGCRDNCMMQLGAMLDAFLHGGHDVKMGLQPLVLAAVVWDSPLLPPVDEYKSYTSFIYIEQHCRCVVCSLCGLRAPPTVA